MLVWVTVPVFWAHLVTGFTLVALVGLHLYTRRRPPLRGVPARRRSHASLWGELGQFVTEVRRRLRDSEYEPRGEQDPIAHWIESDCWRSPATPSTNFAKAPGNRKPSQLRTYNSNLSDERHWRSAAWFSLKDRRGCGDVVLPTAHCTPSSSATGHHKCRNSAARSGTANAPKHDSKPHNSPHKGG